MGLSLIDNSPFTLAPLPPFRLDLTVWVLRRRPDNLVDRWDGSVYRRVLSPEVGEPFEIAVSQSGPPEAPQLTVSLGSRPVTQPIRHQVASALDRLLGLGLDLGPFYRLADGDDRLRPLADQFCGFKPPRFLSLFEALVNGIACQQLTLTVGIRLLNRLAEAHGPAVTTEQGKFHAFPRPQDLASADVDDLRKMGFSYQKARYLTELAHTITSEQFDPAEIDFLDDKKAVERLRSLKGVGRWTAEYALLRGLGRLQIFPADDVGARNHLQRWLGLPGTVKYETVRQAVERWDPYQGLIYFHLLLKGLMERGMIVK